MKFDGRRAVVTGGANGIGAATVRRLHELGADVVVLDVAETPSAISTVTVDLSDPDAVVRAAAEAADLLGGVDVLVNAVAPGFVATRMSVVDGVDELDSEWFRSIYVENERLPLRRAAQSAEVAETIAWLASEGNTYVTGQVLTVDGGLSARF